MNDTWEDISPANGPDEIHLRRSDVSHPLDFFYGRDFNGRYVFLYKGRHSGMKVPELPKLAGIEITLAGIRDHGMDLQLCLLDTGQADIFRALCCNLLEATRLLDAKSGSAGIEIIVSRLFRWQQMLKAAREQVLSQKQITGLCGEILVLRDLFLASVSPVDAVAAWRGPYGGQQDFVFGSRMIEVKTQLSSADRKLRISSVNQLDSALGQIFICHQGLAPSAAGEAGAFTLNSLIDQLFGDLEAVSRTAAGLLAGTLVECGYLRHKEYDIHHFVLVSRDYYRVCEGFPALRAQTVPAGVTEVRYSILLEACRPYLVEEEMVTTSLFGS